MHVIRSSTVDGLFLQGSELIIREGRKVSTRSGDASQVANVTYVLTDSKNRIFSLRSPTSTRYMCRELLAYFRGSLNVGEGLARASRAWKNLADENGQIWSNYGYYVFYEKAHGKTQYDWVLETLAANLDTRRALININQSYHKDATSKDFPCNIGLHFYVADRNVFCQVYSRSEDVLIGLPYDMAFFSFLNELVTVDLRKRLNQSLSVGSTSITCTFSQIYDTNRRLVERLIRRSLVEAIQKHGIHNANKSTRMPEISDAATVITDIYNGTGNSNIVHWIRDNAHLSRRANSRFGGRSSSH